MAKTKIILHELRLSCLIGIDVAERYVRQVLLVDVELSLNSDSDDDIMPALDYLEVTKKLRGLARRTECGLMETFAEEMAKVLLNDAAVSEVRIYCRKLKPLPDVATAGVEIIRP